MKYIDKSINHHSGNLIVERLLADCWNDEDQEYQYANYNDLCKPKYKSSIINLILVEQEHVCCYCMRHLINNHTTTLEHVIPHNINHVEKQEELNDYLVCEVLRNNVVHRDEFDLKVRIIPPARYPHDIAYHNLIASCNSNSHCNLYRGDKKLYPFMYDTGIADKVEYDRAGNVSSIEYDDELAIVGISTNDLLIFIRKIWSKLSSKYNNIQQITDDAIDELILEEVFLDDNTKVIDNFIGEPSYQSDIKKYQWFYYYYQNK